MTLAMVRNIVCSVTRTMHCSYREANRYNVVNGKLTNRMDEMFHDVSLTSLMALITIRTEASNYC